MKSKLFIIVCLIIAGCAAPTAPEIPNQCEAALENIEHVFVFTATNREANAFAVKFAAGELCHTESGFDYQFLTAEEGYQVVLIRTGVGRDAATSAAFYTAKDYPSKVWFLTDHAGRIDPDLKLHDTVVPRKWYRFDSIDYILADPTLLDVAEAAGATIVESGATANEFVTNPDWVRQMQESYKASVVDMEAYYIGNIAAGYGIPFLAVKSVSNFADGNKNEDDYQAAAEASAVQMKLILDNYFKTP